MDEQHDVVNLNDWIAEKERERQRTTETGKMVSIDERRLLSMMKQRHMLAALCRAQGRVRIPRGDLDKITQRDKLDVKVQENGDLVVTFVEG